MAVQESVVDHVTRPLPRERQLHHLRRGGGGPLGETVQRNVFQQSVVTNPTQQVDLNDRRQWRTRSECKTLLEIWHWFIAYRSNRTKVFNYHSKEPGLQNNMPLYPCVWLVCGRRKLETAAVVNCLNSINHLELHNTQVNFQNLPAVDSAAAMNHAFQSSAYCLLAQKTLLDPFGQNTSPPLTCVNGSECWVAVGGCKSAAQDSFGYTPTLLYLVGMWCKWIMVVKHNIHSDYWIDR